MAAGQARREALLFAAVVSALISVVLSGSSDTLLPGERLEDVRNCSLVSSDGKFRLGFFSPLTSTRRYVGVWYDQIPVQTVVWVANRDKPLPENTGVLSISGNGSLSISDANDVVYWSTPSTMLADPSAKLLIGGNFVVSAAGKYAWESFDYPTHAILPGIKLGFDRRSGRNRQLTSWKSDQDPAAGRYTFFMNSSGVPEILLLRDAEPTWRSGPWVGEMFSGVPEMKNYHIVNIFYVSNANEVYYNFSVPNATVLTMVVLAAEGEVKRLLWKKSEGKWADFWAGPVDRCDGYGSCGVFGVCTINGSPNCSCLPGFEPISPTNWKSGIWTEGCKRKTSVDCRNGTDGFYHIARAKLPDTSQAVMDEMMGIDECREACLRNCSCTAYANVKINESSASGCIMWSGKLMDLRLYNEDGQDLFVRLASADLDRSPNRRRAVMTTAAAAAVVVEAVVVIAFLLLIGWFLRRRRKQNHPGALGSNPDGDSDQFKVMGVSREVDLPSFDLAAIVAATDNFSADRTLGIGGFGPVYKGLLKGKREVAVKRLAKSSSQGGDEFMNEVRVIAKLQHRNLVRLLGFCVDREERILVYEYMPNGSLDSILFDKTKAPLLDWPMRLRIIGGVARGLLYLHQDSRLRIIHRDLKAGNVLLDEGMNPKISDFGMARIFSGDERQGITRRVVGTYGYMSPEYAMDGTFSVKSDVYSFGVLVLEMISGKRNGAIFDSDRKLNLLGDAWNLWKEGEGLELVDSSPGGVIPIAEVLKCIKIGLLCVQERPDDRPDMAAVVIMLGGDNAALPPPKPPGFAVARERSEGCGNSTGTLNNVTLSALHGR